MSTACSAGGSAGSPFSSATGSVSGAGGGSVLLGAGGGGPLLGGGGNTDPNIPDIPIPLGGDAACKAFSQKAEKRLGGKADIIWVLDNSGSMLTESQGVQNNMNTFSQFITSTGIDAHVVVVSTTAPLFGLVPPYGVCITPPLGSGKACPDDTNPPLFTHIMQEVDSHNALEQLMKTFPQWQSVIRPDATKTFVVVTDDQANPAPTTADFTTFFNQQFQGSTWRFSGVFCQTLGSANCSGAGTVYTELVNQTGGVWSDMGNPDWSGVFKQLGDAVVADARPVDCEWKIPPPPDGKQFDPEQVNVRYTPTSGTTQPIYGVAQSECTDKFLGWHYDDPATPTRIIACPTTCPVIQGDVNAQVDVLFGCAKEHPPIR
jgi:hypothetical protein